MRSQMTTRAQLGKKTQTTAAGEEAGVVAGSGYDMLGRVPVRLPRPPPASVQSLSSRTTGEGMRVVRLRCARE